MSTYFYLTQAGLIYIYLLFFNIKSKSGTDKSQITNLYSLRTSKDIQQLIGCQQFHNARTEKLNCYFQKTLCVHVCVLGCSMPSQWRKHSKPTAPLVSIGL